MSEREKNRSQDEITKKQTETPKNETAKESVYEVPQVGSREKFKAVYSIVTHGDGDGIISAAALRRAGCEGATIITQPFLVYKKDLEGPSVIVDIALDNRNPQAALEWTERNKDKIVMWIDHHEGGEALKEILGDKYVGDTSAPSCPSLLQSQGICDVPEEWVDAANACDRPTDFTPTDISTRVNSAFKVALVELQDGDRSAIERVQQAQIQELVSGVSSEFVDEKVQAYDALLEATKRASEGFESIAPGVLCTQLGEEKVDKTALFQIGYKDADVVVLQHVSQVTEEKVSMIATKRKDLNLVKAFGFQSGAPFRVTIGPDKGGATFEEQQEYIKKIISSSI